VGRWDLNPAPSGDGTREPTFFNAKDMLENNGEVRLRMHYQVNRFRIAG
jgi:hypothetical protein